MTESEDIIDLIRSASTLKRINRSGWSLAGVDSARPESVAEHTYGSVVTSIFISQYLMGKKTELNLAKIVIMAAIHDLPEFLTSDIPRISKIPEASLLSEAKLRVERTAIQQIFSHHEIGSDALQDIWEEYSRALSLEARIVRGSDIIDMLVHALSLEESGVSPAILDQFFSGAQEVIESLGLDILKDIYSTVCKKHRQNAERVGLQLDSK
jgi:5'-deoxynucleotidase YfbR-like HD superfamily hydrolase